MMIGGGYYPQYHIPFNYSMQTANSCFNKLCLTTTTVHVRLSVGAQSRWRQLPPGDGSYPTLSSIMFVYRVPCIVHLASGLSLRLCGKIFLFMIDSKPTIWVLSFLPWHNGRLH